MPKLGGGIEGFNVDMAMEIGKRLKRPVNIEGTQFSGLIPGLNAKKYDWIAAPTTVTPQRAEQMLFTEGYLDTDFQFLVKKSDAEITSLDDLKGKTISVNKGSAYENWAKENMGKFGFKYDIYDTNADAVQAVLSGRAQANLAGNTVVAWAAKQERRRRRARTERQVAVRGTGRPRRGRRAPIGAWDATSLRPRDCQSRRRHQRGLGSG
jgi:polar amino acid transport system substrate-binding protein